MWDIFWVITIVSEALQLTAVYKRQEFKGLEIELFSIHQIKMGSTAVRLNGITQRVNAERENRGPGTEAKLIVTGWLQEVIQTPVYERNNPFSQIHSQRRIKKNSPTYTHTQTFTHLPEEISSWRTYVQCSFFPLSIYFVISPQL